MGIIQHGHTYQETIRPPITWSFKSDLTLVILYILILISQGNCQTVLKNESSQHSTDNSTKNVEIVSNVVNKSSNQCHNCLFNNTIETDNQDNVPHKETKDNSFIEDLMNTVGTFTEMVLLRNNKTSEDIEKKIEEAVDNALNKDKYVLVDGIEIRRINTDIVKLKDDNEGRGLFSKYTYEYRMYQKIKTFIDTHILSINLPKAAQLVGFRSFGLKKFLIPFLIGAQVFKSILLAMFLPSILGSFGKMIGKGISQVSAASSQASYPPANVNDQESYNNENKDAMGYETDPAGAYVYPQDGLYANMAEANEVNDLSNVDLSRFGGQKVSYLPVRNNYYKQQVAASTNYKVFHKIPSSSMILSNYDPFYSPLLSRLDGIFARLGLAPSENSVDSGMEIGGQALSDIKLEACREQLICLMYASPTKYAPYSNLVSAQLSRELNELRRPVSDNPEILRFFRYMRAARRGQEGVDCTRGHPTCVSSGAPAHTMIAAYHDINKLVTARKLPD